MSSQIGKHIKVSVFGESHGPAIGMVMDAPPPGLTVDFDYLSAQMERRAPGKDPTATARKESDLPEFLSGLKDGVTTGAPLTAVIRNDNTRSSDYSELTRKPRPSHADYAAFVHYKGFNDIAGGGHFSGRLTAPLVVAGSVLRMHLHQKGIEIGGHICQIGTVHDRLFDPIAIDPDLLRALTKGRFSLLDSSLEAAMRQEIAHAAKQGDSVGGAVEIAVTGLPAGLGGPMFDGVENSIAAAVFGVPAVKGIEFGDGFGICERRGSEANDPMHYENGRVTCLSNHNGGVTGGITNSMPVIFRVALKPTPSISKPQQTVDLEIKTDTSLVIHGRHDPCIVPRALPAIEAVTAIAVANLLSEVSDL